MNMYACNGWKYACKSYIVFDGYPDNLKIK